MAETLLTFVHFSDTHLPENVDFTPDGKRFPYARARKAIDHINALPFPVDFVLHTGDVGNDQSDAAGYAPVREALAGLKRPLYVIPGNHDLAEPMFAAFAGRSDAPAYFTFDVKGVRFVCLNSVVPRAGYGSIGEEQLAWLDAQLSFVTAMPVVVALHHHPFSMHADAIDAYILHDGEELHRVVMKYRDRVCCVLFGHIHETSLFVRDGISYISAASTNLQLRSWPGQQEITPDSSQVASFNVVTIDSDRMVLVRVWRIQEGD